MIVDTHSNLDHNRTMCGMITKISLATHYKGALRSTCTIDDHALIKYGVLWSNSTKYIQNVARATTIAIHTLQEQSGCCSIDPLGTQLPYYTQGHLHSNGLENGFSNNYIKLYKNKRTKKLVEDQTKYNEI